MGREPSRMDASRRREAKRRMYRRRRIGAAVVLVVVLVLFFFAVRAVVGLFSGPSSTAASRSSPSPHASPRPSPPDPNAGALGDPNPKLACSLLTAEQIQGRFGGSVGDGVPVWPYCQWTVGADAFVALLVAPGVPLDQVPTRAPVLQDAPALGAGAYYGTDRALYFATDKASYWLLYQKVGEFTGIHDTEMEALAHDVMNAPIPTPAPSPSSSPDVDLATSGPEVQIATPTATEPLHLYFGGDSLAAGPSWAFVTDTQKQGLIQTLAEYQVGTGLVRNDYWDWYTHMAGVLAGRRPQVVVFMAGANDQQALVVKGQVVLPGTDAWTREYRRRAGALMDLCIADGRRMVWAGMPVMLDPTYSAFIKSIDDIVAEEASTRPDVTYVDTYSLFSAPGGGYASELAVNGVVQPVRLDDGVHLNATGSELLAQTILAKVDAIVGPSPSGSSPSGGASPTGGAGPSASPSV